MPPSSSQEKDTDGELEEGELKSDDEEEQEAAVAVPTHPASAHGSVSKESSPQQLSSKHASNSPDATGEASKISDREPSPMVPRSRHSFSRSLRRPHMSSYSSRSREDPKDKEAMLISMRTKLLEARSRELEMKMRTRQTLRFPIVSKAPTITSSIDEKRSRSSSRGREKRLRSSSRSREKRSRSSSRSREKRSRSSSKGRGKPSRSSSRGHEKTSRSSSRGREQLDLLVKTLDDGTFSWPGNLIMETETKPSIKYSLNPWSFEDPIKEGLVTKEMIDKPQTNESIEIAIELADQSLQGPKTPPDNRVFGFDDEQVEWPNHLVNMTIAKPSIPYSINPEVAAYEKEKERKKLKRKKKLKKRKSHKSTRSNGIHQSIDLGQIPIGTDIERDFTWYYNYFKQSYEMDHNQASYQAYYAVLTSGTYEEQTLNRWLNSNKFIKESVSFPDSEELVLKPSMPRYTIIKSQQEITLPNGQLLPAGTIQTIVHPYPKVESEVLGPYFDFF